MNREPEQDGPSTPPPSVGVLTQNVRGLGDPRYVLAKLNSVVAMADAVGASIVVLTETKLDAKRASALVSKLLPDTAPPNENKKTEREWFARHSVCGDAGSGVTMLLRTSLSGYATSKRAAHEERCDGYAIRQDIVTMTGSRIAIFGVYMPHDPTKYTTARRWLLRSVDAALRDGHEVIIAGDLNTGSHPQLLAELTVHRTLVDMAVHADDPRPTYLGANNQGPGSRLDYVITSQGLAQHVHPSDYAVDDSLRVQGIPLGQGRIRFDHAAVSVTPNGWTNLLDRELRARIRRAASQAGRRVLDASRASAEQKDAFAAHVRTTLCGDQSEYEAHARAKDVNRAWACLNRVIDEAIRKHLPTRRVGGTATNPHTSGRDGLTVAYRLIDRWGKNLRYPLHESARAVLAESEDLDPDDLAECAVTLEAAGADTDDPRYVRRRALRKRLLVHVNALRAALNMAAAADHARARRDHTNTSFESNLRFVLDGVLGRHRPPSTIAAVEMADGTMSTEPDDVKQRIAEQVQPWFASEGRLDLDAAPEHWRAALEPVAYGTPEMWDGLMAAITRADLEAALSASVLDKAPGASGHPLRLYQWLVERDCHQPLLDLLNACLERRTMPEAWRKGLIYLIPKTAEGFRGHADGARPITLLETLSKLLMKVLLGRIYKVLMEHTLLRGARFSGMPETDTTVPIAVLNAAARQATFRQSTLWAYFEDKSKAFDTVPHELLRLCLRRLHMPEAFVDFYMDGVLTGRTAQVLTSVGHSACVYIDRGIPQGAVESPFTFCTYYDPLLCVLQERFAGVQIDAHAGIRFHDERDPPPENPTKKQAMAYHKQVPKNRVMDEPQRVLGSANATAVAYMDDLVVYATSRAELEQMMALIAEFNALARVRANAAKGAVLVLGEGPVNNLDPLMASGVAVPWVPTAAQGGFRYLGVWIDRDFTDKPSIEATRKELARAHHMLRRATVPAKIVAYILNSVVMPAMLYRTRLAIPPRDRITKWENSMRALYRDALSGSVRLPVPMLYVSALGGLTKLSDAIVSQHMTDLCVMLNSPANTLEGASARCLVGLVQVASRCPVSPLANPSLALAGWTPRLSQTAAGIDQLIPMMRARKLSLIDSRGEFHLGNARYRLPLSKHAPMLFPRTKNTAAARDTDGDPVAQMAAWQRMHRFRAIYFVEEIALKYRLADMNAREGSLALRDRRREWDYTPHGAHVSDADRNLFSLLQRAAQMWNETEEAGAEDAWDGAIGISPYAREQMGDDPAAVGAFANVRPLVARLQPGAPRELTAYTDGSMVRDPPMSAAKSRASAAAVFPDHNGLTAAFPLAPAAFSSTRAEWAGIALAASMAPPGSTLLVRTDSQAAQRPLARLLAPRLARRTLLRTPNHDLVMAIRAVTATRDIALTAEWVRGHAGDPNNERADKAAGNVTATLEAHRIAGAQLCVGEDMFARPASEMPYRPAFSGLPLNNDPRKFIKKMAEAEAIAETTRRTGGRVGGLPRQTIEDAHWRITGLAINGGCSPRSRQTSEKLNQIARFRMRALAGMLPCRKVLNEMRPGRFARGAMCACNAQDEAGHWVECQLRAGDMEQVQRDAAEAIRRVAKCTEAAAEQFAAHMVGQPLSQRATVACLVTNADYQVFRDEVVPFYKGRGAPPAWPTALAQIYDTVSLALQDVWRRHFEAQAEADAALLGPAAAARAEELAQHAIRNATKRRRRHISRAVDPNSQPAPRPRPLRPPARSLVRPRAQQEQRLRGRCPSCDVAQSTHNKDACARREAVHASLRDVLLGGDPARVPGLTTLGG